MQSRDANLFEAWKHDVFSNSGIAILLQVTLCLIKPLFSNPWEKSNVFNNVLKVNVEHNIISC
jgi:hypothetical protein